MAKKPFSIRVEKHIESSYKAIQAIENVDGETLLKNMISDWVSNFSGDKKVAYEALLKVWKEKEDIEKKTNN